jgi:MFS family permease
MSFSPSQVSWIGSIQVFLTFFVSAFASLLADAGYARSVVVVGSLMSVLGTFMTSLASKYWQVFLAQGLCTGVGMGMMYIQAVAVVGSYFDKRRGLALTTSASGGGVGRIVFPLVVRNVHLKLGRSVTVIPMD